MTSTYTANNGIEKIETGDQSGTWGETTNTNFDIIDRALNGVGSITLSGTSHTLTTTDGSLTDGMFKVLSLAGSPTGTNTITISPNDQDKLYFVKNASGQSAVFSQGTGANVTIPNGSADIIFADGAGSGAAVSSLFASAINFGGRVICDDTTDATSTTDGSVQTDGGLSVAKDAIFGNDVTLKSDSAVLGFGADTDTTLTHTDGTGLTLNSTNKLTFGDAASFIQQSSNGVLRIDGEATIDLNASTAVTVSNDLNLDSDDAVIGFGADTDIKIIHHPDNGLFLKSTATGDDTPFILTLQTGDTDIASGDQLGIINFQAPDEAAGTDAVLAAAGIEAVSEGDFSASSNATSLVFKTGQSEAAAEKVRITSAGLVGLGNNNPASRLGIGSSTVSSSNTITFGKRVTSAQSNLPLIGHDSSDSTASDLGICATSSAGKINFYVGNDAAGFGTGSNDLIASVSSTGIAMASGKGIDFSANSNVSGMSSELFDDYEEGTWTGTIIGSTSSPSSGQTTTGNYTKIGRQVFADALFGNVDTTGAAGQLQVIGWPYDSVSTIPTGNVMFQNIVTIRDDAGNIAPFWASGTLVNFYQALHGTNIWVALEHNAGVSSANLYISLTYIAAT